MAGKAKEARDEYEIRLITALEELELTVASAPNNKRVLELKIQAVNDIFDKLQRIHAQYCQKAKISLGSAESKEFLKSQTKLKVNGIAAARSVVAQGDDDSLAAEMEQKTMGEQFQLKVEIEGKLSSLQSMTGTTLLTTDQFSSIMEMLDDSEGKLKRYMECNDILTKGKDETAVATANTNCQNFFKTNSIKSNELKCIFFGKSTNQNGSFTTTITDKHKFASP